jgi:hypothetical protein
MKAFKIKKSELSNLESLYKRIGVTHGNRAYVTSTYVSSKTYKNIKKALAVRLKKEAKYLSAKRSEFEIGMYLLNLGPVEIDSGILENVILVDTYKIERAIEEEKQELENNNLDINKSGAV